MIRLLALVEIISGAFILGAGATIWWTILRRIRKRK
jgi:hypothetical protein